MTVDLLRWAELGSALFRCAGPGFKSDRPSEYGCEAGLWGGAATKGASKGAGEEGH